MYLIEMFKRIKDISNNLKKCTKLSYNFFYVKAFFIQLLNARRDFTIQYDINIIRKIQKYISDTFRNNYFCFYAGRKGFEYIELW